MKIKRSDAKTKTKILVNAEIKGGVLSANIAQLVIEGVTVWNDQLKQLKSVDPQLARLVELSGTNINSGEKEFCHFVANACYFAEKVKDSMNKIIYTSEDHSKAVTELRNSLHNHAIFELLIKKAGFSYSNSFREYLDEASDLFLYKNFTKSYDHWVIQLRKNHEWTSGDFKGRKNKVLFDFFMMLIKYKELKNKYKFTTLPSKSDVWTIERLAEHCNVTVTDLYPVYFTTQPIKEVLPEIIEKGYKNNNLELANLIKTFNIVVTD